MYKSLTQISRAMGSLIATSKTSLAVACAKLEVSFPAGLSGRTLRTVCKVGMAIECTSLAVAAMLYKARRASVEPGRSI